MSKQYTYIERRIPATPRNKRLTDSIVAAASTGGGYIGGSGGTSYWQLVTTDEEGNALPEEQQYLVPVGAYPVVSLSDVVAYATTNPVANTPVTGYDTFGLVKIAEGGGLVVTDGVLSIDPSAAGGLDQEALESYLKANKYVTEGDLATKGYLMLTSPLTGYVIADEYTAISPTDTLLTAIGKLERRFDGYVDLTTDQTIGGVKTFTETIYGGKDIVCYATDSAVANTPVASSTTFGLVKIGENINVVDGVISAVAQQSGVQFTPGTALELTANSVLNVKFGTTGTTACAGNDSRLSDTRVCPYSLSWSGYGSGRYNGAASKSLYIPYCTSDLTNDSGYIKDGNGNFTTLSGSGNSSQYLAGNGQFYTIAASEISFPYGYVTLSTVQTITAQKWFSGKIVVGPTNNVHLRLGEGSGDCINGYKADDSTMWNIYLNYEDSSAYTLVDPSHNMITTGDVVAYAASSAVATTPVASTTTFGLVKIGENLTVVDGVISAVAQQSGVQFTPGTALELTTNSVLNVKLGTASNTACAGNDSRLSDTRVCPYSLSWSGYSSGSYDGSGAKSFSIPSNTNQLTNGAGYIKDGNGNFTTLTGSGNNTQYLAGNGQFCTIAASEISFPNGYVTLSTEQTITALKWFSGKIVAGPTNNVHIRLGDGSGNCINGYKADDSTLWNVYLNYEGSSAYTLVDSSHNMITTGDVVAYATSSAVANTPVASTTTFGLVKIGSGISVSGGVISVSVSGGSSSWDGGTVGNDITIQKSNPTLRLNANNNSVGVWSMQNNTTNNLCFYNSKFSGICAQVNYTSGAWTGNSDVRLKIIDGYETDILNKIYSIDIIYYYWKFGVTNRRMIGVSAQDIRQVLPELVNVVGYNDNIKDYTLGLDYATLGAVVAIGGLKELYSLHLRLANEVRSGAHWRLTKDEQIRQLQQECAELRVRINELEKGGAA